MQIVAVCSCVSQNGDWNVQVKRAPLADSWNSAQARFELLEKKAGAHKLGRASSLTDRKIFFLCSKTLAKIERIINDKLMQDDYLVLNVVYFII